jgi:hypothetical protein
VINCPADLLGCSSYGRILRHRDNRVLQCAKLLKAGGWINASGDGGLHETSDELTRQIVIEVRQGLDLLGVTAGVLRP